MTHEDIKQEIMRKLDELDLEQLESIVGKPKGGDPKATPGESAWDDWYVWHVWTIWRAGGSQ
jgi:hypothetical protein